MTEYRVTIDRGTCDGVFACLVRDPRFVEDDHGLATIDPESAEAVSADDESHVGDGTLVAVFDDDRLDEAEGAAAACPLDAITVEVP